MAVGWALCVLAGRAFALSFDGEPGRRKGVGVARSRAGWGRGRRRVEEGEWPGGGVGGVERACGRRRVGADSRQRRGRRRGAGQSRTEALLECLHRWTRWTHCRRHIRCEGRHSKTEITKRSPLSGRSGSPPNEILPGHDYLVVVELQILCRIHLVQRCISLLQVPLAQTLRHPSRRRRTHP